MAKARLQYLSDAEKQFVHEQTVRVLEEIGIGFNTPMAIDLLEEAGAPVDREKLTARVPWELVERCLKTVPTAHLPGGSRSQGTMSTSTTTRRSRSRPTAPARTCTTTSPASAGRVPRPTCAA